MVAEHGSPRDVAKDVVLVVKTIPRERVQRRVVERKVDVLVSQFQEQIDEVTEVTCRERVSGRVWGQIAEVSERDEIDGCDWMATAPLAGKVTNCKTSEARDSCGMSPESVPACTSSHFGPELGVVFTCFNPARKVQENSVETRTLTLDELTTKTML